MIVHYSLVIVTERMLLNVVIIELFCVFLIQMRVSAHTKAQSDSTASCCHWACHSASVHWMSSLCLLHLPIAWPTHQHSASPHQFPCMCLPVCPSSLFEEETSVSSCNSCKTGVPVEFCFLQAVKHLSSNHFCQTKLNVLSIIVIPLRSLIIDH